MSTVVIRPDAKYTKPEPHNLIGTWSDKRYKSKISYQCVFSKEGRTYILDRSGALTDMPDNEYLKAMREAAKVNANWHPFEPKEMNFDVKTPEHVIDTDSDIYKYFKMCPDVVVDGVANGANPLFTMVSEDATNKKAFLSLNKKLEISNFVTAQTDEKLRDFAIYFGQLPKKSKDELLLQLLDGDKAILFTGGNLPVFERVFMNAEESADTDLILTVNKAIFNKIIEYRPGQKAAYYWKDAFLDTTKEGVYSYFRNETRFFQSLKGEIVRALGETPNDNTGLPAAAKTKPNRTELWVKVKALQAEGKVTLEEGRTFANYKQNELEKIISDYESTLNKETAK